MKSDSLTDPLLELDMVWQGEGLQSGRNYERRQAMERSSQEWTLRFCPGWGICGVRLGQPDVGAAFGPPHIWTRYEGAGRLDRLGRV